MDITKMGFPVWSGAIHAQGTVSNAAGSVDIPVVCTSAPIQTGDVIVADADSVVVVPRKDVDTVAAAAKERIAKEAKICERLRKSELGLDFYGLRTKLTEPGVQHIDEFKE